MNLIILYRISIGKEDYKRFKERYCIYKKTNTEKNLIWLHAASVGESLSLLPLIEKIIADNPKINILITSTTKTSAEILEKISAPQMIHQMAPYDTCLLYTSPSPRDRG